MGRRIAGELEIERIFYSLAREGRQLLDCHCCAVLLLDLDRQQLKVHTMIGRDGPIEADVTFEIDGSAVGVAIHRLGVEVTDLAFTEEMICGYHPKGKPDSMLSSPIVFITR